MTLTEKFEKNIDQVNSDFQAIKSKIIECGVEVADGTKTAELAENVGEVYNSGRKAENDAWWDAYQQNGNRTNYANAFAGIGWDDNSFRPKYDIKATLSNDMMFASCNIKDLGKAIRAANVSCLLGTRDFGRIFQNANCEIIDGVTFSAQSRSMSYSFFSCTHLKTITPTIMLTDDGRATFSQVFTQCYELVDVRFSGVIGQNGLDLHWSTKLSKASILSILNALSTTTNDLIVTFSKEAVDVAFADGQYIGSESQEWSDWENEYPEDGGRSNWTLDLV